MGSADDHSEADWAEGQASAWDGSAASAKARSASDQVPLPALPHGHEPRPVRPLQRATASPPSEGKLGVLAEGGGLEGPEPRGEVGPSEGWDAWNEKMALARATATKKRGPGRPPGKTGKPRPPKVSGLMLDLRRKLGAALEKDPAANTLLALTKCVVLLAQLEGAKVKPASEVRAGTGKPPTVKKRRGRAKPNNAPSYEDDLAVNLGDD